MIKSDNKIRQGASNREWGALAESIAADWLLTRGYTLRERNYRFRDVEIDIIAQKDDEIIFVEVKARTGKDQNPLDAVDARKRKKIMFGADIYLRNLDQLFFYRFDIITITGTPEHYVLAHYPDSYRAGLGTRIHSSRPSRLQRKRPSRSGAPDDDSAPGDDSLNDVI